MRLLHISDVLLGNLNYRKEVREANGADLIDLDRQAAFDRAVGCAIEHDVDVLLIAGGLVDGKAKTLDPYRPWLDERIGQLAAADIATVIYDPQERLDELDAQLVRDNTGVSVNGVRFEPVHLAAERAAAHPDELVVAVGHGKVKGIGGSCTFDRELDDRLVASLEGIVAYTALGGMLGCQPLTPSGWMSGAACGLFGYHAGDPGGIIVQLGTSTRRVLDLIHVSWDCRRRVSVALDVGGMSSEQIAGALHSRLDDECWKVDEHVRLDDAHPLAQLYGAPSGPNGVGWWSRPVLDIKVRHAACPLSDVFEANPLLKHMLCGGEHLLALVDWCQEGASKPVKHKFAPERLRA